MAWSKNTNKQVVREYDRKWRAANKEKKAAADKRYYDKLRSQIVDILGGRCIVCGTAENLEFDHINNDGRQDRALIGSNSNKALVAIIDRNGEGLQLLCEPHHLEKTLVTR